MLNKSLHKSSYEMSFKKSFTVKDGTDGRKPIASCFWSGLFISLLLFSFGTANRKLLFLEQPMGIRGRFYSRPMEQPTGRSYFYSATLKQQIGSFCFGTANRKLSFLLFNLEQPTGSWQRSLAMIWVICGHSVCAVALCQTLPHLKYDQSNRLLKLTCSQCTNIIVSFYNLHMHTIIKTVLSLVWGFLGRICSRLHRVPAVWQTSLCTASICSHWLTDWARNIQQVFKRSF